MNKYNLFSFQLDAGKALGPEKDIFVQIKVKHLLFIVPLDCFSAK